MSVYTLYNGDCLKELKKLSDNSIDSIVTDPPYGLSKEPDMIEVLKYWMNDADYKHNSKGFMGKDWDSFVPSPLIWKECLRVLKPGGYTLSFFGTRTYDMGVLSMRLAGFEIREQIGWSFGSGFPKSLNVSKAISKQTGIGLCTCNSLETDTINVTPENKNIVQDIDDKYICSKCYNIRSDIGGTALKPAFEPIVMARKPLSEKTVAANVLKWGTGAINIDESRIPTNPEIDDPRLGGQGSWKTGNMAKNVYEGGYSGEEVSSSTKGRFPANFIHDGSEEVVSLFPNTKAGGSVSGKEPSRTGDENTNCYGEYNRVSWDSYKDDGSAARFFYCAKASKKDRNEGLDDFEEKSIGAKGNGIRRVCATCGASSLEAHTCNCKVKNWINPPTKKNNHPTVKPTKLMQYLVKMVTPPDGTVLDPFMGSGSTGKAAVLEGYNFVGIELQEDFVEISKSRIEHAISIRENKVSDVASEPEKIVKIKSNEKKIQSFDKFFDHGENDE